MLLDCITYYDCSNCYWWYLVVKNRMKQGFGCLTLQWHMVRVPGLGHHSIDWQQEQINITHLISINQMSICIVKSGTNSHHSLSALWLLHTLRLHYAHAAANLNSGYSKYAKVARVHYFCTIALRTSRAVLTRAWASRRVGLHERRVDSFSKWVIIFCW